MPECSGSTLVPYSKVQCANTAAGVKRCWLGVYNPNTTWTYAADGQITSGSTVPSFKSFALVNGTTLVKQTMGAKSTWGNISITQSVELGVSSHAQSGITYLNNILRSDLQCVLELKDGNYILLGEEDKLEVSAIDASPGLGGTNNDDNVIKFTLTSTSANEISPTISSAYAAVLLA